VAIDRWLDETKRLIVVGVVVVLATALAAVLVVRSQHGLLRETFRERSVAYAQAFATSSVNWLEPLDLDMLRTAAQFLLLGSARYVQVAANGELLIDAGDGAPAARAEMTDADPALSTGAFRQLADGPSVVDVSVPLAMPAEGAGTVRVGIETTSIVSRGRTMTWTAVGVGVAVDVLILALLVWSGRGRARGTRQVGASSTDAASLTVGELRVDGAIKKVMWRDAPVALTPKQYALVAFLAERSERVVSEAEIVDAVWAESPYADAKDVKQCVYLVRKRLAEVDPLARDLIENVPGFGYRLASSPVDEEMTDG